MFIFFDGLTLVRPESKQSELESESIFSDWSQGRSHLKFIDSTALQTMLEASEYVIGIAQPFELCKK